MPEIKQTFTGTGNSAAMQFKTADFSLSGTFVGTVGVQRLIGGDWRTVESFTVATEKTLEYGTSLPTRPNCSAHTSGSAVGALQSMDGILHPTQ